MKKLMIMCVVAVAASFANAASIIWGEGANMYTPDSTGAFSGTKLGTNGTGYFFELTASEYASLLGANYAATAENVFKEYATQDGKTFTVTGADQTKASKTNKFKDAFEDSRTFAAGDDAYAAIIIKYSDGAGQDYYIANLATYHFDADIDGNVDTLGSYEFGSAANTALTGWTKVAGGSTDVPEPTSGLLLVLGGAMLALRRRRA